MLRDHSAPAPEVFDPHSPIGKYFPYGEDRTSPSPANPPNGQEKFATYTRDAESGLDYAYQRYYTSGIGRFLTPDSKSGSASSSEPQAYNRYARVIGDPTNRRNDVGTCDPSDPSCNPFWCTGDDEDCPPARCDGGGGIAEFEPVNPTPCEPVSQPPPAGGGGSPGVTCDYNGATTSTGGFGTGWVSLGGVITASAYGYFVPVSFQFTASGSASGYNWSTAQTFSVSGSGMYANRSTLPGDAEGFETPSYTTRTGTTPAGLNGATATIKDRPGLASSKGTGRLASPLISATQQWTFTLTVKVQSASGSVNDWTTCGTIVWTVDEVWSTLTVPIGLAHLNETIVVGASWVESAPKVVPAPQ
jgi:RHS repeat-associated protein